MGDQHRIYIEMKRIFKLIQSLLDQWIKTAGTLSFNFLFSRVWWNKLLSALLDQWSDIECAEEGLFRGEWSTSDRAYSTRDLIIERAASPFPYSIHHMFFLVISSTRKHTVDQRIQRIYLIGFQKRGHKSYLIAIIWSNK